MARIAEVNLSSSPTHFDENDQLDHPLMPYVQLLGLYIKLTTTYKIEISLIHHDDGTKSFQIDEEHTAFYFEFSNKGIEFAFGNFNMYNLIQWDELFSTNNSKMLDILHDSKAPDTLIQSCQLFLISLTTFKCLSPK